MRGIVLPGQRKVEIKSSKNKQYLKHRGNADVVRQELQI